MKGDMQRNRERVFQTEGTGSAKDMGQLIPLNIRACFVQFFIVWSTFPYIISSDPHNNPGIRVLQVILSSPYK